ncbi:MAG: hypothetical protein LAQ69_18565 [Acidobacteriia bacterium]|nr:hypothetical protein [Terriglobia bacterium]
MVRVRHSGAFTEIVPLLARGAGSSACGFTVSVDPPSTAGRVETNTEIGLRRLAVMRITAKDSLTYRLQFARWEFNMRSSSPSRGTRELWLVHPRSGYEGGAVLRLIRIARYVSRAAPVVRCRRWACGK